VVILFIHFHVHSFYLFTRLVLPQLRRARIYFILFF
jgi:hypothetical protein